MIENRNVNIITDVDGKKLVLINDIRFKGQRQIDWDDVKQYLEGYVRFALPVYEENVLVRYNISHARLLINHAENDRKYLYDILAIKKKRASRNKMYGENPFLIIDNKPFLPSCPFLFDFFVLLKPARYFSHPRKI